MSRRIAIPLGLGLLLAGCQSSRQAAGRFHVADGFTVEVAAPPSVTGPASTFTFDSLGRPVISKENGHPTVLSDKDQDGSFETQTVFSDQVRNCRALWFDGRSMYGICEDSASVAGLYRVDDSNGDDRGDSVTRVVQLNGTLSELGSATIRRGPDGAPTLLLGNVSALPADRIDPLSPYRHWSQSFLLAGFDDPLGHDGTVPNPGGVLARLDFRSGSFSLQFGGLGPNARHAFHREGEAFVYESAGIADQNLPWHRASRTLHGIRGADYGWRRGSNKWPGYYLDSLPPTRESGQGSACGAEFYQHTGYPKEFRDALLECDAARGRVWISHLRRDGASYQPEEEDRVEFLRGAPFGVTALETGPDGFLYLVTGGPHEAGGLYRIRYTASLWERWFGEGSNRGIEAAVRQPQPLSSWGHAALLKSKQQMGNNWAVELDRLARDTGGEASDRIQAILLLQRFGPAPGLELLRSLTADPDARVRAALAFVLGQHATPQARELAASALKDPEMFVRRRAAETVVRMGLSPEAPFIKASDIYPLLNDGDRFVRYAGRIALERLPRGEWAPRALAEANPKGSIETMLALIRTAVTSGDLDLVIQKQASWLTRIDLTAEDRVRLLRALQVALSEYPKGPPRELKVTLTDLLYSTFPTNDERLNRELSRLLAWGGQEKSISKIVAAIPRTEEKQPLQIHYVYCARTMRPPLPDYCASAAVGRGAGALVPKGCSKVGGWTREQKETIVNWFVRASKWQGGESYLSYLGLLFQSYLELFDEDEKQWAIGMLPRFGAAK